MSTRWYPIYQKGNPQLRIFLPNFWMKLVAPDFRQPESVVQFHCSMEMTKTDIQNYLTKIYNIDIVKVRTRIALGRFVKEPQRQYIMKLDDVKVAYVTLPKDQKFTFPDLFPKDKKNTTIKDGEKSLEDMKNSFKNYLDRNKERPGMPNWYTI
ncbi:probable 39S ribosomal protein L23, mitochondrial [Neodiprion virginianus]|uniref:Large ribosomal subunit protein uL23m n=1 Tax=Neodiprion lecontei TaxID=441921 RepID=A0A6J0BUB8_NEOLC|nr:probable 39S ribosomal protein L23, mitochondrial [Neodiprion lecontei]XP_046431448.1 probable 39S ribosomal protein L23, mitochondrial [Neodiprion fabricii]XP_046623964.1 probable 39S ribosomal protein L23, mitochondrial [Neodiprion virginianus]